MSLQVTKGNDRSMSVVSPDGLTPDPKTATTPASTTTPAATPAGAGPAPEVVQIHEDTLNYESRINSELEIQRDTFKDLLIFPSGDIEIETIEKIHRTKEASPDPSTTKEPHVVDCLKFYSQTWNWITNKYIHYSKSTKGVKLADIPAQIFEKEGDSNVRTSTATASPDQLKLEYLEPYDQQVENQINELRKQNRIELFRMYSPDYDWEPGPVVSLCNRLKKRSNPNSYITKSYPSWQLNVKVKNLQFLLGELEPFWCSLSLMDVQSKKKISENYYFDLNSDKMKQLLELDPNSVDPSTQANSCVFSVPQANSNIYLLLRIEKVLQSDIDEAIEPYLKVGMKDQEMVKSKQKIESSVSTFCKRLSKFRQVFAFGFIQLFNDNGSLAIAKDGKAQFDKIYPHHPKDNLLEIIAEQVEGKKKPPKVIPGFCDFEISKIEFTQDVGTRLDPSLNVVSTSAKSEQPGLAREVQDFPQVQQLSPYWYYINNFYIYLETLNFSSRDRKHRNLGVRLQVKDNDDPDAPGLDLIYGRSSCKKFVNDWYSQVTYHNKTPAFSDEIKIQLPLNMTEKHHLLFSFYQIHVAKPKKGDDVIYEPLGYAVLPLYQDKRILENNQQTHHQVSVISNSKLEAGYLTEKDKYQYVDNGKPVFRLRFYMFSTVYASDPTISNFWKTYHSEGKEENLKEALAGLAEISNLVAVRYMPVLLNQLLRVIASQNEKVGVRGFKAMVHILLKVQGKINENRPRTSLLNTYVDSIFTPDPSLGERIHKYVATHFLNFLKDKKTGSHTDISMDELFNVSWFIFEIIIKSYTLSLQSSTLLETPDRSIYLDITFSRLLKQLISFIVDYFRTLPENSPESKGARDFNRNLALFIRDLFSIFDRGQVIDMVQLYIQEIGHRASASTVVVLYKYEFLKILTDYEHFIPLNLPLFPRIESGQSFSEILWKNHPLVVMFAKELLHDMKFMNPHLEYGVTVLTELLAKHEFDQKLENYEKRQRVVNIYFPLILHTIDDYGLLSQWMEMSPAPTRRDYFVCLLWVLKNCNISLLRDWWRKEPADRLIVFLDILSQSLKTFEYGNPQVMEVLSKNVYVSGSISKSTGPLNMDTGLLTLMGKQSREVGLLLLDILELFIEDHRAYLASVETRTDLMDKVVDVLLVFLRTKQSENFTESLFGTLRGFVVKFRTRLFTTTNSYCGGLVREVLRLCNFASFKIRSQASVFFYLMLKHNFEVVGNFGRMSVQATTSLSQLVGEGELKGNVWIRVALSTISHYALHEYSIPRSVDPMIYETQELATKERALFARQVQGLTVTLTKILSDTMQVEEYTHSQDDEMVADLYYRIANGYKHTPDLRVTWLESLAKFHEKKQNVVEAGFCLVHVAALVHDYLVNKEGLVPNPLPFQAVSPTLNEFAEATEEGMCQSSVFQEKAMIHTLRSAVELLKRGGLYEYCYELYKIIIPILEYRNMYKELSSAHQQLHDYCNTMFTSEPERRLFWEYFRVGYYGSKFGELDSKQFVYKEPALTHLITLSGRLKDFWTPKCGEILILDSTTVDQSRISKDKCYLQITHLEPFLSPEEQVVRGDHFRLHTALREFVYQTPFTKSGKAQGNIDEQYMRKTILTVEHPFPYLLRRQVVTSRRELIFEPIENAIELIQGRIDKIREEVISRNLKTLQQVLQGTVRLQVNSGAMEICRVFLGNEWDYDNRLIETLRIKCEEFLGSCRDCLKLNAELLKGEMKEFTAEMETGYKELESEMTPFLSRTRLRPTASLIGSSSTISVDELKKDGSSVDDRESIDDRTSVRSRTDPTDNESVVEGSVVEGSVVEGSVVGEREESESGSEDGSQRSESGSGSGSGSEDESGERSGSERGSRSGRESSGEDEDEDEDEELRLGQRFGDDGSSDEVLTHTESDNPSDEESDDGGDQSDQDSD